MDYILLWLTAGHDLLKNAGQRGRVRRRLLRAQRTRPTSVSPIAEGLGKRRCAVVGVILSPRRRKFRLSARATIRSGGYLDRAFKKLGEIREHRAAASSAGVPGGSIIGVIRPEAIRTGASANAKIPDTMERCEYRGPTVRLSLTTDVGLLTVFPAPTVRRKSRREPRRFPARNQRS
jgi:hypothetical protein